MKHGGERMGDGGRGFVLGDLVWLVWFGVG